MDTFFAAFKKQSTAAAATANEKRCYEIKGYQPSEVYPNLIPVRGRMEAYRKSMCGKDEICLEGAWGITWKDIVFWLLIGCALLGVAVIIGLAIMYLPPSGAPPGAPTNPA